MKKDSKADSNSLRLKAEDRLKSNPSKFVSHLSEADTIRLMHELEVQQIELELQQEEIMWAEEASERSAAENSSQSPLPEDGKAAENDRLKSEFLAGMCHEILTPMNGILGFAGLLQEPGLSGAEQQEYISFIEKSGTRMLNIINDIISIPKVEPAQNELSVLETRINEPIRELKILIAEDDEISAKLIARAVKLYGREVLNVINGVEAVEACRNNPDIDLVLMDIKMPVMDGYEATRQIRQFNTDVVIIAQTAYAMAGDREKTLEAGCNDYIAKPINKTLLKALMKKYFNINDK
jgi:CheY-like chemotaxis protein